MIEKTGRFVEPKESEKEHSKYIRLSLIGSGNFPGLLAENVILNSNKECSIDEGRICVNSTSVNLSRGMNPGGFLILRCVIPEVGTGQNLDPLVQIQASTQSNFTTLAFNINHDSVEIFDLSWSLTSAKAELPDNLVFSKNDTIHFSVGIDINSISTIVVNSKSALRLGFKGTEQLTKFKSLKSKFCTWKYEMSLTFPSTELNVKYTPEINNSTETILSNNTGNGTQSVQINSSGEA
ncbi:hypothetical protein HWI79_2085 [Cryptosporidium felis]|nr:hypothetical protein HWI79_2085 [Cryptosporidium felis]